MFLTFYCFPFLLLAVVDLQLIGAPMFLRLFFTHVYVYCLGDTNGITSLLIENRKKWG